MKIRDRVVLESQDLVSGGIVRILVVGVVLVWGTCSTSIVWAAVEAETTQQKSDRLQGQAQGDLFQEWNFDRLPANELPAGFSSHVIGGQPMGQWVVRPDQAAFSAPQVVHVTAACADPCLHLLVKDELQYEYPDVWVGLRAGPPANRVWAGSSLVGRIQRTSMPHSWISTRVCWS